MAHKIKFSLFSSLFQFFSFLSDKNKGNVFFVKYKVLLGSLILGLSTTGCATRDEVPEKEEPPVVTCYMIYLPDSTSTSGIDENIKIDSVKIGD